MSTDPPQLNPLEITNPKRQANDPIRAYEYQIWQSVFRWITLKPNEVLFLEKAEDFDVVSADVAETTQVKDTARSGSVTLNSEGAIEAISNFWIHQQKNPNYIRFKFLTTSSRGMEKSNPFNGIKGLDYWDICKRANTDLNPLRDFLVLKSALPEDLRHFISTSSDEELRSNLISRIEWASDQGDHEAIKELIKDQVLSYGVSQIVQPSESEKVVSHLFTHIFEVIRKKKDRQLKLSDFAILFEERTTRRFTAQEIESMRLFEKQKVSTLGSDTSQGTFPPPFTSSFESSDPAYDLPSLDLMTKRDNVVSDLQSRLNVKGLLVLKGSTGMGKSVLAVLISDKDGGRWKRLDFRGLEPEQIKRNLINAATLDAGERGALDYIVDDLNFDKQLSIYERTLSGFLHTVISRGGRIVVTTQGDLPNKLKLSFDLPEEAICEVPSLTEEEIKQIAIKHGCPDGKILESWGSIIKATTAGHPQLVHARVKKIAADVWPRPQVNDLLKDAGADEVRREARRRLQEYLPSENARNLAYRLSIYSGPFKRSHALYTAQHPTAITNAGESFELLVGPWVESYGRDYYMLSPLLKNSAKDMFSPQDISELHRIATCSFFVDRVLTQREISGILVHGLVGQFDLPLDRIAHTTEGINEKDWAVIARDLEWFAHIATESDEWLFKSNPVTSLNLRRLQFRIAAEVDSMGLAPKVVSSWDKELLRYDKEFSGTPKFFIPRLAVQQMFNISFLRFDVPIPIRTIVRNIVTTIALGKHWEAVADSDELVRMSLDSRRQLYDKLPKAGMQMLERELGSDPDKIVDISDDVYFAAVRCKRAEDVSDFIDELEEQASEAADEVWAYLGTNEFTALLLINAAWLSEVKAESPNWERSLEVLDKVARAALAKGADHLVAGAYRTKAIVLKEYAKDKGDAIQVINEGVQKLGYPHPALQDYLANIYMRDERYEDAINVWKQIPPEDEERQTSWRTFSHRDALMCAGNLSDWSAAAQFALEGEKAARRLCHLGDVVAVGYLAEHALAIWKSGNVPQALSAFVEVVEALETLPDPNSDIKSFALHRNVIQTLGWLAGISGVTAKETEPRLGAFSYPSEQDLKRENEVPRNMFSSLLRLQIEQLKLKHSLRSLSIESLISDYAKFSNYSKALAKTHPQAVPAPDDLQMIYTLVFAALANWMGHGKPFVLTIDRWKEDARFNGLSDPALEDYFNFTERIIGEDLNSLRAFLNEPNESAEKKAIASLVLSHHDSLSPEDRFIANVFLIQDRNVYAMWREETENIITDLIANSWISVVKNQRFSLLSPSITIPEILSAALDTSTHGLEKVTKILIAAQKAVNITFPK
jgi:tetratricopeptide (TPR) repeat protein